MKKKATFILAAGLTFSALLPSSYATVQSPAAQKHAHQKMQILQENWDAKNGAPEFLSGKLSSQSFKSEKTIREFLKNNQEIYQINPDTELTLVDVKTDELGMTHYKYVQSLNGVPIDGGEFLVHTDKNGIVKATNGKLRPSASDKFKNKTAAKISDKEAIDLAWKHINVTKQETEVKEDNAPLKEKADVANTVEKSKLVVYEKDGNYYLTHKVELQFIYPYPANWKIYVDANNGKIVDAYNAVAEEATSGYGYGVLGDYKTLNTYYSNGTYYLYDVTKPMSGVIETRTAQNGTSLPGSYSVDSNNAWTASSQRADVDAHYYAGVVYDYYKNTHNRNSFDNNGATIRSTVHYSNRYNNAFWNGVQMVYGDGDGTTFAPLSGGLDVVAHELTHAVTDRTAGLEYRNQSGALNESMSDVFACFVDSNDYLIGEDVYTPNVSGDALRSLSNPQAYGQPAHMNDYVYTSSDNGGVHTNSGIPNKAAYLTITAIGKEKAEKIYYRALTVYLTPTSNFSNARAALLQAAADLYGSGSSTYNAVANAWNQVGVY
ncbi:thermolysin [Anoxybacillus sp. B7M1]|jgi:bacillolysin|uniref:M4 family metallopeptidase n=1 Tax=unclassified Anoxybacillus TaxID=2639704 RepID=UPI0005CD5E76|nr:MULTISPECIES: M4 family metallopeptidase [unclassified Anoxybacillus]ANB58366.1 thermolysin [Anoxybacillus sp. B2M1]ANB64273.1 thermolysin [Anoxybacillus sp. B7M1]